VGNNGERRVGRGTPRRGKGKWLAVMALTPLKVGRLNEGLRGGLMVGGSNNMGAASRGAEWWPEVAGCGGGAAKLGRSRRKVMIGVAHLSTGHG
jgi:hypothetical protein